MAPFAYQPTTINVYNHTESAIHVTHGEEKISIQALGSAFSPSSVKSLKKIILQDDASRHSFEIRLAKSSKWCQVRIKGDNEVEDVPWRIFQSMAAGSTQRLLVLPARNMASFLGGISDSVHLSNILLPGTHESMALYGWPFASCQNSNQSVLSQLQSGIRVFDVRLAAVNGTTLISYHSIISEKVLFSDIIATFSAFLSSVDGQRECVVLSIKQEDGSTTPDSVFSSLVYQAVVGSSVSGSLEGKGVTETTTGGRPLPPPSPMKKGPQAQSLGDMWYLENRVPTLGEVRGKIVLFSRFGYGSGWPGGMGITPMIWPDSSPTGFSFTCGDTTFQMQDWYNIGSISKVSQKFAIATSTMITNPTPSDPTSTKHHVLPMSFSSASSIPLALPSMVANGIGMSSIGFMGVNQRMFQWATEILTAAGPSALQRSPLPSQSVEREVVATDNQTPPNLQRVSGWLMMDFFDEPSGLAPLLVEMNWMNDNLGVQSLGGSQGWGQWFLGKSK
ncbi:hypothetical protein FRB94_006619 [Tulasnella sp. JGI-2019a]|nr:hypothetical protein FRB94_006619 [Tulasnella sp. JGI-2019a]